MRYIPTEAERILAAKAAGVGADEIRYRISPPGQSITCLVCNRESFHPQDVQHRYCGNCDLFHAN